MQKTGVYRLENNLPLTDSKAVSKIKKLFAPILLQLTKSKVKYKLVLENPEILNGYLSKNQSCIFIPNHTRFQDTPLVCKALQELGRKGYILSGKQRLSRIDELFFNMYGSVWMDRKDKNDMQLASQAMHTYLQRKTDMIAFLEATWNFQETVLIMAMKWGMIDIAYDTSSLMVPMNLRYEKENMTCYASFEEPIFVESTNDKSAQINALRDTMATVLWEWMEQFPIIEATDENVEKIKQEFYREIQDRLDEYPLYDVEYEQSCVFKEEPSYEEVFEKVKKLPLKKETAFLVGL